MGRPERPIDPAEGPVALLAWQLRQLREAAGRPSYRQLAKRALYSASTLADAAKGERLPSLEVTLAYARACGGDPEEWQARWNAAAHQPVEPEPVSSSPYQGLMAFQCEQAEWFFGRAQLVDRLLAAVEERPLVAVIGASGSGKSSLLRAGLLGAVKADDRWQSLLMTPGEHPLEELSGLVAKLSGADANEVVKELWSDPAALDIALRDAVTGRTLLVVDQFEEAFTVCGDEEERARFVAALLDAAVGPERRTTVVLGVRADFLARLTEHPGLASAVDAPVLVGPPNADELREIIVRPAARAGLTVPPELVATALADCAGEPGALPLLSHALLETWHRRTGTTLTLAGYQEAGGVRRAIAETAERVYRSLDPAQHATARRIFLRLTTLDGTRRPATTAELDDTADVVTRLARARLVVVDEDRVQIAHAALITAWPRLHRWLTDDRDNLAVHRRLTEAAHIWERLARDDGALYRGAQLGTATAWWQDHPDETNHLETAFLQASTARADAEQHTAARRARLLKRLLAAMAALVVLAGTAGGLALRQSGDLRQQNLVAVARQVSLQARGLIATDPALAGRLAARAYQLNPDAETLGGLLSAAAVPAPRELNVGGAPAPGIAFSPDHALLATAGGDGTIGLWDTGSGARLTTLDGKSGPAKAVAFTSNGNTLASLSADGEVGTVILWDVAAYRQKERLEVRQASAALAFSGDGQQVAVGLRSGDIELVNLPDHGRRILHHHRQPVVSLTFSPDGELLVSADGTSRPAVWNLTTGQAPSELAADHVDGVHFGPSGRTLAASADDRGLYLWNLDHDEPVRIPGPDLDRAYGWAISPPVNGRIAVADEMGTISVWDWATRTRLNVFQDRGRNETFTVTLSPDGRMLASSGFNGSIVLHDLDTTPFTGINAPVNDLKISPDRRIIAAATSDGLVHLYDPDGRMFGTLGPAPGKVQAIAFSPDGRLLATATRTRALTLWNLTDRRPIGDTIQIPSTGTASDIAFDPTGRLIAAATFGPFVWELTDPPTEVTARYPPRLATALTFSPDGHTLTMTTPGGNIIVAAVPTGEFLGVYPTGQGAIQDLALSPDGATLATAGDSRTVKLWDTRTHRELGTLRGHTAPIQTLAFSPDGKTLASAGNDHTIMIWNAATRTQTATLTGHTGTVSGLAFLTSTTLLSGGEDGKITRWSLAPTAALTPLCHHPLTQQEWDLYLPTLPYQSHCA
ncbi:nSTAND1 domain-containing NTPase [Nonomuraea sediminis]|uniref:nSTAND1 domain-containing NTPase n=1 Tax=Nonomuraea sediminis TaxID=2835864 RepID=UPI001BDCD3A7|nr:helix-turn-helix domain-containing protein [Nonomuraea sediminis]